ncbi:MAG TPA: enoyl-CoA hydratase-related protein [Acidimicrobiales bacterium]|nr:enoyl-CoA hydratase-related protein [Acidimicrobiales bacterium]
MAFVDSDEVLTSRAGPIVTITINRPAQRNALSPTVTRGLRAALASAKQDTDAHVVVLRGAGDRAFCAGADLSSLTHGAGFAELHDARGEIAGLFEDLWALGKPTIARVQGFALAGGFGLALSCDFLVASEDSVFGTPEIDVGLWPFMITVPILRAMTPKQALELMMTGRRVAADEALRMGFVNRVVPVAELDEAVAVLAAVLAAKSPAVMRLGRSTFYRVVDDLATRALPYLHSQLTVNAGLEDAAEGVAAFKEKRAPEWRGR